MQATLKKVSIDPGRAPLKSKLVFVIKLLVAAGIGFSFSNYQDFYAEHLSLFNLAYGLNSFLTASVLISVGRFLLISWYGRRTAGSPRIRGNAILGINQVAGVLEVVFAVLGTMLAFGINPKEFLTSITLVAMAIALLFRDYITNMISGLLIMFSDRFTIGDNIRIGEYQGKIIDITLSNIVIRNEDEDLVLIPNNTAFTLNIVNQTLENKRKMVIEFDLPLDRAHEQTQLASLIQSEVLRLEDQIVADTVQFRLVSLTHTAVKFKLSFVLHTQGKMKKAQIKDALLRAVLAYDAQQKRN